MLVDKFSSAKVMLLMLSPPILLPKVKSSPSAIKPGIMRWKLEALKKRSLARAVLHLPFSPVQRARKFSAVLGTVSL